MTNNEISAGYVGTSEVERLCLGSETIWEKTSPGPVYSAMPLTFEIISAGTINWKSLSDYFAGQTIQYSLNDGNWTTISANTSGVSINVSAGDTVRILGNLTDGGCDFSMSTAIFNIYGNIMSIAYGNNYEGQTVISAGSPFYGLFRNINVVSAEHLIIPATTLTNECYTQMFYGCTRLTTAPELPATTLGDNCYLYMFSGCTSLTTAPALPATTLTEGCYTSMFGGCTGLTTAPELPATTLANNCYSYMFYGCVGLTTAPELHATTLAEYCYSSMFAGCTSLNTITCLATDISADGCLDDWVDGVSSTGTFYKSPSATGWSTGTSGIPSGWTVLDYAG